MEIEIEEIVWRASRVGSRGGPRGRHLCEGSGCEMSCRLW